MFEPYPGGNLGKTWRFREAALWLLDTPQYYDPPPDEPTSNGRKGFMTFTAPQPPADLPPARNASAPREFTDKYKAGWLVPDALNLSPRLRLHLELIRRHYLALRDAFALSTRLFRPFGVAPCGSLPVCHS